MVLLYPSRCILDISTWSIASLNVSDITSSTTANWQWHHVLNLSSALDAFLHKGSAAFASAHMPAWAKQYAGFAVGTNDALFDLQTNNFDFSQLLCTTLICAFFTTRVVGDPQYLSHVQLSSKIFISKDTSSIHLKFSDNILWNYQKLTTILFSFRRLQFF